MTGDHDGDPATASVVTIVRAVAPEPVNVVVSPADETLTVDELSRAGMKRISLGVALYAHVAGALDQATRALGTGDIASATEGMDVGRLFGLLGTAEA